MPTDRVSRFDPYPGDIKPPRASLYPRKPVQPMTRWLVRMVIDSPTWQGAAWKHDARVWAFSSTDAVGRARSEFYGTWATDADRERLALRVLEVMQVDV